MQKHVENNRENFAWFEKVIAESLLTERLFSFLFEVLRLDGYAKIVSVVFLHLDNDTYGHSFMSELHSNDFVKVGTGECDFLCSWFSSHNRTNFHQSEFLNVMVANQDIVLIAANA